MKPAEFSNRIGVSEQTLRNWDNSGKLVAKRTKGNHRFYTEDDYNEYMGISGDNQRKSYIYARIPTMIDKYEVGTQIELLKQYTNAKGAMISNCLVDSGYDSKQWNILLDLVIKYKVKNIYVSCNDTFINFGFKWFEQFCKKYQTNLIQVGDDFKCK